MGLVSETPAPAVGLAFCATAITKRSCTVLLPQTTNNRMELTAAVEGLRALKEPCAVEATTDSEYLRNGISKWITGWKRNGWRTSDKKPVLNQDLWKQLDEQVARHQVIWKWTRGHASHADNNRCDELATRAAREQSSSRKSAVAN